jgi:hypothetical protein
MIMSVTGRFTDSRKAQETTCEFGVVQRKSFVLIRSSKVYCSFGGLLLYIDGPYNILNPLRVDYVYLLMKK